MLRGLDAALVTPQNVIDEQEVAAVRDEGKPEVAGHGGHVALRDCHSHARKHTSRSGGACSATDTAWHRLALVCRGVASIRRRWPVATGIRPRGPRTGRDLVRSGR